MAHALLGLDWTLITVVEHLREADSGELVNFEDNVGENE